MRSKITINKELLSATDELISHAVQHAQPMVLRGLLYQLTGDESVIEMQPGTASKFGTGSEMANESDAIRLREKAADFLKQLRDSGVDDIDLGPPSRLRDSLSLTSGHEIPERELHIWQEEAAFDPWARGVHWRNQQRPENAKNFKVAVIGTGISGLNVAVQLKRAGIPFTVFEKNPEVGGSWYENRYPGARVDTSSRGYTHLFSYDYPFPHAYCPRDENLKYFNWVADCHDIRDHIIFNTEISAMTWHEDDKSWTLQAEGPDGFSEMAFNAVISCVGFLSRPKLPQIDGMENFEGIACHTATWPEDLDIEGKRVAVVGSGASGYQTTPVIAKKAEKTFLFQRTPNWCFEDHFYLKALPEEALWLDRNLPFYSNFVRFRVGALINPDLIPLANWADPDFDDQYARNPANKATRETCIQFVKRKLEHRPELIEKMIPDFPPMASRPIRIDSEDSIFDALATDKVDLISESIERITEKGIQVGGIEYEVDVIVFATGFRANDYLWPMEVRGRNGLEIQDVWEKDGPRAYLGAMVPEFPNLFMCYGPNSNNFGGFTVVDLLELIAQFALRNIAGLIEQDKQSVEVSDDAYWRFAAILDEAEKPMIYMDPRANNYYQNGGRSCVNGPIDIRRMWRWLNNPAGSPPADADARLNPHFGADLLVRP